MKAGLGVSLELVWLVWLSICLSLAQLFSLCALMTVVVHSFVADSSQLDCCDLIVCFLRFKLDFFPSGQPYISTLKQTPFGIPPIKFMKSHSSKCSRHKWVWLRRSVKVSSFKLYKFDPFSSHSGSIAPHSGSIPRELVHSYALGCLWVVTVCCNTVGRHG